MLLPKVIQPDDVVHPVDFAAVIEITASRPGYRLVVMAEPDDVVHPVDFVIIIGIAGLGRRSRTGRRRGKRRQIGRRRNNRFWRRHDAKMILTDTRSDNTWRQAAKDPLRANRTADDYFTQ